LNGNITAKTGIQRERERYAWDEDEGIGKGIQILRCLASNNDSGTFLAEYTTFAFLGLGAAVSALLAT
jgi:hypothetical protein